MKEILCSILILWQKTFAGSRSPSQIFLGLHGEDVLESPKNPNETKSLSVSLYVGHYRVIEDIKLPITKELLNVLKQFPTLLEGRNSGISRKAKSTENEQTSSKQIDTSTTSDKIAERLENVLNGLTTSHKEFRTVRDNIRDKLVNSQLTYGLPKPEFFIQYKDPNIAQIPFHKWEILESFEIEPVFSEFNVKPCDHSYDSKRNIRVLVILGSDNNDGQKNLDLAADIKSWEDKSLPNVDITTIIPPSYESISSRLWEQDWDILYFAGHSDTESGETLIQLNNEFKISFKGLQDSLKTAVKNGLKLAIFNSCISLGAAADLHQAGVPAVVAMRYAIPDIVAHTFLKFFLQEHLNRGRSVSASVQQVRKRFQDPKATNAKEGDETYKFASWLPVVFQVPSIATPAKASPLVAISISFFVTCLVIAIHTLGLFQSAELNLYDHMMNARAAEPLDPRIVLIHIDKQDQDWQESRGAKLGHESIDNEHLAQLLKRLDEEKPKVIGMSLTRKNLKNNADENQVFIDNRRLSDSLPTVIENCSFETSNEREYFPEIMEKRNIKLDEEVYPYGDPRIGFTNITIDSKFIGNTRRLLLMQNLPNSYCGEKTWISFPLRIVLRALDIQDKEIEVEAPKDRFFLKFKNVEISNIVKGQGGYQIDPSGNDLAKRLSILFNYKNNVSEIVPISLKSVLTRKNISFKDKIVIIGGIGKDAVENVNNIYIHTLAVDYLLRVFEGGHILKGVENDIYFFAYCYIIILLITLILQYLCNNLKHIQFSIFFFVVVLSSLTISLVNLKILENLSIWVPSIPILAGILFSCLFLSMCYQKFDKSIYNK